MLNLTESQMNSLRRQLWLSPIGDSSQMHKVSSGVDAVFIATSETVGIKFYRSEYDAKKFYTWMKILSTLHLAPKVWDMSCVSFIDQMRPGNRMTMWYFYTERAVVVNDYMMQSENSYKASRLLQKQKDRMKKHFSLVHGDGHTANWGFLRGRIVMIDIGALRYIKSETPTDYGVREESVTLC